MCNSLTTDSIIYTRRTIFPTFYYFLNSTNVASANRLLVPDGLINPVVNASALTWLIILFHRNLQFLNHVTIIIKTNSFFPRA